MNLHNVQIGNIQISSFQLKLVGFTLSEQFFIALSFKTKNYKTILEAFNMKTTTSIAGIKVLFAGANDVFQPVGTINSIRTIVEKQGTALQVNTELNGATITMDDNDGQAGQIQVDHAEYGVELDLSEIPELFDQIVALGSQLVEQFNVLEEKYATHEPDVSYEAKASFHREGLNWRCRISAGSNQDDVRPVAIALIREMDRMSYLNSVVTVEVDGAAKTFVTHRAFNYMNEVVGGDKALTVNDITNLIDSLRKV